MDNSSGPMLDLTEVPDDFKIFFGNFFLEWSNLENLLNISIGVLIDVRMPMMQAILDQLSFSQKVRILQAASTCINEDDAGLQGADYLSDVAEICKELEGLNTFRNMLAHGSIVTISIEPDEGGSVEELASVFAKKTRSKDARYKGALVHHLSYWHAQLDALHNLTQRLGKIASMHCQKVSSLTSVERVTLLSFIDGDHTVGHIEIQMPSSEELSEK